MRTNVLAVSVFALGLGLAHQAAAQVGSPSNVKSVDAGAPGSTPISTATTATDSFKYADMNDDGLLNVADFTSFLKLYALGDPIANCDASTAKPELNAADFTCYLQVYAFAQATSTQQQRQTPSGTATQATSLTATNTSGTGQ